VPLLRHTPHLPLPRLLLDRVEAGPDLRVVLGDPQQDPVPLAGGQLPPGQVPGDHLVGPPADPVAVPAVEDLAVEQEDRVSEAPALTKAYSSSVMAGSSLLMGCCLSTFVSSSEAGRRGNQHNGRRAGTRAKDPLEGLLRALAGGRKSAE
jgi:hypothetical protein